MSQRKVRQAGLSGFSGPFYPKSIIFLNKSFGLSQERLLDDYIALAARIPGFVRSRKVKTTDGYEWFTGFRFCVDGLTILITLPYRRDWSRKKTHVPTDRCIAVYLKGEKRIIDQASCGIGAPGKAVKDIIIRLAELF